MSSDLTGDRRRMAEAGPDLLLAVALAVVLGALSASGVSSVTRQSGWLPLVVAAFVALHLSVVFRVRATRAAYVVACGAAAVLAAVPVLPVDSGGREIPVTPLLFPSSLTFLVLLYSVAAHTERRTAVTAGLVAVVGAAWAGIRVSQSFTGNGLGDWLVGTYVVVGLIVVVAATWTLGRLAVERRTRRAADRARLREDAVRAERERIARDMHDVLAHSLAVIVRQAEGGAFVAPRDPDRAAAVLDTVAATGRSALADLRGLLGLWADEVDTSTDSQPGLEDVDAIIDSVRAAGVTVVREDTGAERPVGDSVGLAAYRVVQEALTNTLKHAGPGACAEVSVAWTDGELAVGVTDDGGPAVNRAEHVAMPGAGAGLSGLRSRVTAAGGRFESGPTADGYRVSASFPADRAGSGA